MADYIKRTDVQDVLNSIVEEYLEENSFQCNFAAGVVTHLKDDIDEIPAADVVEIVRCQDCVHCAVREYDIIDKFECEIFDVFTDPLDYCSHGERKENEQT